MNGQPEDRTQQTSLVADETQVDAALAIARRIEQRMLHIDEKLQLGDYDDLRETITRLHACHQLLQATDRQQFLSDELAKAAKQMERIERRFDRQQQADRKQDNGFSFGR